MALNKEQEQYIIDNYSIKTCKQIGIDLNVSYRVIEHAVQKLHLRKAKNKELNPIWTQEEIDFLLENKDVYSRNALAKILNHSPNNVIKKLKELGVYKKSYTKILRANGEIITGQSNSGNFLIHKQDDIDFIIQNINDISMKRICSKLNCSYHTVARLCRRYNVNSPVQIHDITGFSKQEIQIIKDNFDKVSFDELCKLIPRWSESSILRKCKNLKLIKRDYTYPEFVFESILKRLNIEFNSFEKIYYTKRNYYEIDFVVNNIAFEIQGDYWHANPKIFPDKDKWTDVQKKLVKRDIAKKKFLEEHNYIVVYVWEYDLNNDIDSCIKTVLNYCSIKNP